MLHDPSGFGIQLKHDSLREVEEKKRTKVQLSSGQRKDEDQSVNISQLNPMFLNPDQTSNQLIN